MMWDKQAKTVSERCTAEGRRVANGSSLDLLMENFLGMPQFIV